jgi:hypothetical protein
MLGISKVAPYIKYLKFQACPVATFLVKGVYYSLFIWSMANT